MITKFNDYLNESKKVKKPIDFRENEQDYRKRLFEVIDDILPQKDRLLKVYYENSSSKREIDAEIIVNPIINVKDDGYNVHFSFDIYGAGHKQLISFALYDIKSGERNPVWKDSNIGNYYLDNDDIDKIVKLIKSLANYTGISDRGVTNLIDYIYKELKK